MAKRASTRPLVEIATDRKGKAGLSRPKRRMCSGRGCGGTVAGFKFRRQHVIDRFVADFYCSKARLVVEIDGPIHDFSREEDALRQQFLESLNLRVLRFHNDEVLDLDAVLRRIEGVITTPLPPLYIVERGSEPRRRWLEELTSSNGEPG